MTLRIKRVLLVLFVSERHIAVFVGALLRVHVLPRRDLHRWRLFRAGLGWHILPIIRAQVLAGDVDTLGSRRDAVKRVALFGFTEWMAGMPAQRLRGGRYRVQLLHITGA